MIFITHPEHGADNVTESELPIMQARGWKVTDRNVWMGDKAPKVDVAPTDVAPVVRRGRPAKVA